MCHDLANFERMLALVKTHEAVMDRILDSYVEITGRIASSARFCEFLDAGGKVLNATNDAGWRDVTLEVLQRERQKIRELERTRWLLYPDLDARKPFPQAWAH